jgi:DNA-binding NtrC family response regulator
VATHATGLVDSAAVEARLAAALPGTLEHTVVAIAQGATGAEHGSLFLWDAAAQGLALVHHEVDGIVVTLPSIVTKRESQPGIAQWVFEHNAPHLCRDAASDKLYTRYLLDVGSVAAVPVRKRGKPIGVLAIAARAVNAFDKAAVAALTEIAELGADSIRRAQLDRQSRDQTGRPFLIKGLSPAWREVERRIDLAAPTTAPILIRGESGTGKDLVARAIHANSKRAGKPYVTVNCAAIPDTLLESILFGHVKGAFTGATVNKIGEFEKAHGGTLFLDEIGEIPLILQAKVLRAVEQGEVQPVGSNEAAKHVDVRLVAATNRNLEAMAHAGTFRDDLFYRLSVMTLDLPALRDYKDSIEVLAGVFVEQSARALGKPAPRLSPAVLATLRAYRFPGNVRELRNAIEHALILAGGNDIAVSDLPRPLLAGVAPAPAGPTAAPATVTTAPSPMAPPWGANVRAVSLEQVRAQWLEPLERTYLLQLLDACEGNVRLAAKTANVAPLTLYRLLEKHKIVRGKVAR